MDTALITLFVVICYKAKKDIVEYEIIKGTRIFGYIALSIMLVTSILKLVVIPEKQGEAIFTVVEAVILFIVLIGLKKDAEKIAQKEKERWW